MSHMPFLYQCVKTMHVIHRTMFILALNDTKNTPLSKSIIFVHVSFIPPTTSIQRYRQLFDGVSY